MANNQSSNPNTTSPVVSNQGKVVEVPHLKVPQNRIFNFVEANRKAYFEEHSMEWALDQIIERGIAEITRAIKTGEKRAKDAAAGALFKDMNMTVAQAKAKFAQLEALLKAQTEADAQK